MLESQLLDEVSKRAAPKMKVADQRETKAEQLGRALLHHMVGPTLIAAGDRRGGVSRGA
jgi:hypothetical protein